jgi:hypothetical protein
LVVATVHVWFDAAAGPFLRGTADLGGFSGGCEPWHVDVDAGVEWGAHAGFWVEYICFDCEWNWHCIIPCWGGCCFGIWVPDCDITLCDTEEYSVGVDDEVALDLADFWGTGDLELRTITIGTDLDHDGYRVRIARSDPDQEPPWSEEVEPMTVNDQLLLEGGFCWSNIITGVQGCFLLATHHEITLEDVNWNCRVTSMIDESVCLPFNEVTEVSFEVTCTSMSRMLSDMIDEFTASGAIASEGLRRELLGYLDLVERTRVDGSREPIMVADPLRSSCRHWISVFVTRVREETGTLIEPAAAALLLERAEEIRAHVCGGGRQGPLPRMPAFDNEARPEDRQEPLDFQSSR